jgi:hypothetical protein
VKGFLDALQDVLFENDRAIHTSKCSGSDRRSRMAVTS